MIYLDKEKTKKADIKPNQYNEYVLKGEGTYYVFGDTKVIARGDVEVYAYDDSKVRVYDTSRVSADHHSIVYAYDY